MKFLLWALSCAVYFTAGILLPWWAPCLVGFVIGFFMSQGVRAIFEQTLCATIAAFIPAIINDMETQGRISLAISGVLGAHFHPLGYLASLLLTGVLTALGSACGASLREALEQFRGGTKTLEPAADREGDLRVGAGAGSQSANAPRLRDRFGP